VVKRRLHKYVTRRDIREGSYVVLKDYKLATAKRLNGKGEVRSVALRPSSFSQMTKISTSRYLAIFDLYSIGEEKRLEVNDSGSVHPSPLDRDRGEKRKKSAESSAEETGDEAPPSKVTKIDGQSTLNTALRRDPSGSNEWHGTDAAEHHRLCHKYGEETMTKECRSFTAYAQKAIKAGKPLQPVSRPLRLSTLASVTGANASRNKTIDILALIDSVDDHTIKRKDVPLYRDIHIADPSTEKIVTLSVFIDPVELLPSVGELVLFRSVTTHEYKGGKLNAYPQHCDGKDWYIPNPYCINGCKDELKPMENFKKEYKKQV